MSEKSGGTKKRSFDEDVSDLKKQGKSEESVRKIMGSIKKNMKVVAVRLQKKEEKLKDYLIK